MRIVEASGRTVDEAVRDALRQLDAGRDDVEIEVVEEGSKGLFGLLGSRRARVRVQLKDGVERRTAVSPFNDGFEQIDETDDDRPTVDDATGGLAEPERSQTGHGVGSDEAEDRRRKGGTPAHFSRADEQIIAEKLDFGVQFIAGILERLDVEAALESRQDDDGISHIHIVGDDLGLIIGRRGQTLDALQFLVNQAANKDGGPRARLVLDAGGYRARRAEALEALAGRMADKVVRQGRKVALEPMNAFERRIVHMSLANDDAVETYSEGEDPHRRIVIAPATRGGHR